MLLYQSPGVSTESLGSTEAKLKSACSVGSVKLKTVVHAFGLNMSMLNRISFTQEMTVDTHLATRQLSLASSRG